VHQKKGLPSQEKKNMLHERPSSQKFTSSSPSSSQKRGVEVEGVKNNGWILDDFLATRTDRGVVVRFGRDWSGVTGVRPTD